MIEVGSFRAATCGGTTRRTFLRAAFASPLVASALSPLGRVRAEEYGEARAKSVIFLWLWGGPSHLDTFDPKPDAPSAYRGVFSTIPTRLPGVHFTELFPQLARRNDRFALIRSHVTFDGGHLPAGSIGLTGDLGREGGYGPNFGSIAARHHESELPPFVSIGRGQLRDAGGYVKGYGGGKWGKGYDPFSLACGDDGAVDIPALRLLDGTTPASLRDRRRLLTEIDSLSRRADGTELERWDRHSRKAFDLLASEEGRAAFDLTREDERVRDAYGRTSFGQSCLLARRLAEAGVPWIQVNWSEYVEPLLGERTDYGWDTHANNFEFLNDRHGPILDRALSALLDDLGERGLLDSTLLVCMGEFGRTPRINGNMSRDHWQHCYSSIWAGAGVTPGRVIGESDARAEHPITPRISPDMVGATMLERIGVTTQLRARYRVLENARIIDELF